jgi:hypothetical protein
MSENPAWRLRQKIAHYRRRMLLNLQLLGLVDIAPEELAGLESSMGGTLPAVQPSDDFRYHLKESLSLAARQRTLGMAVEQRHTLHPGLVLGLSAGLLATTLGVLLVLLRSRWLSAER